MGFAEFLSAIRSPRLQKVALHWNAARGDHLLPGWSDLRPSQIAGELPIIWSYKYDRQSGLFTGRLAGHLIEQAFGKSFRGTPMAEIYPAADYPRLHANARRIVCDRLVYHGSGMVFRHVQRIGQGERIIMPLADDGERGDGLLGATVYEAFSAHAPSPAEEECWFSL